jgi:hypothetical protein
MISRGEANPGSPNAKVASAVVSFPTPWNQLQAGILFSSGLPMMIFREPGISEGIFGAGTSEVFIHQMPMTTQPTQALDDLDAVFQNWVARVRRHSYGE